MKTSQKIFWLALSLTTTLAAASAQTLELVSRSARPASLGLGDSTAVELSADGRWAVFVSSADNLVTNDHNGVHLDVFLRDLENEETTLVSANAEGTSGGNANSLYASISSDGNYVLFASQASDLVEGDSNDAEDVFLWERATGELTLVSGGLEGEASDGISTYPAFTSDARYIFFESEASNLVEGDANNSMDLFRHDRVSGATELVTVNMAGTGSGMTALPPLYVGTHAPAFSEDGRYVAFISPATNLVSDFVTNTWSHVYLRDIETGITTLLSNGTNLVAKSDTEITMNGDGTRMAYIVETSTGSYQTKPFIYDIALGESTEIPLPAGVTAGPALFHSEPALSEDGRYVAYNLNDQIYLWDSEEESTQLVTSRGGGLPAGGFSRSPMFASGSSSLYFLSSSEDLQELATHDLFQLFRYDLEDGETTMVSTNQGGDAGVSSEPIYASISGNGEVIALEMHDGDLVEGDDNNRYDIFALTPSGVKVISSGDPAAASVSGNGASRLAQGALSWDGRYVVFTSTAGDLVPEDENEVEDVFVRDLIAGTTTRASVGSGEEEADGRSLFAVMSGNGRYVAFISYASNLVADDTNDTADLFIRDLQAGETTLVRNEGVFPVHAQPALSADGEVVAYVGGKPMVLEHWVYAVDLKAGAVGSLGPFRGALPEWRLSMDGNWLAAAHPLSPLTVLNVRTGEPNEISTGVIGLFGFSEDGGLLYYQTYQLMPPRILEVSVLDLADFTSAMLFTNSLSGVVDPSGRFIAHENGLDIGYAYSIYTIDTETTERIFPSPGETNTSLMVYPGSFSGDGRWLAFSSRGSNVVSGDLNRMGDLYLYDQATKAIRLVSETAEGASGDGPSVQPVMSRDGSFVLFQSSASDLLEGDKNLASDIYLYRLEQVDTDEDGLDDGYEMFIFGSLDQTGDVDADGDGMSNSAEIAAGTNPLSAESVLMLRALNGENGVVLRFQAARGESYQLQVKEEVAAEWSDAGEVILATSSEIAIQTDATEGSQRFYRLVLQE